MKLNKKNKGKVHPSPPSSSSPPLPHTTTTKDTISALNLLPAAILSLIAVLTTEEREVLAYLITRSIKATAHPSLLLQENGRRRRSNSKRTTLSTAEHKPPVFDCGCFDCYTSYWFRWDSSPNRELIHQAIEAFEEHLATGERSPSKKNARAARRREKFEAGRRSGEPENREMLSPVEIIENLSPPVVEVTDSPGLTVEELPDVADGIVVEVEVKNEASPEVDSSSEHEDEEAMAERTVVVGGGGNHKGLARKVLPDVIGLFNSRLWSLWSPNV